MLGYPFLDFKEFDSIILYDLFLICQVGYLKQISFCTERSFNRTVKVLLPKIFPSDSSWLNPVAFIEHTTRSKINVKRFLRNGMLLGGIEKLIVFTKAFQIDLVLQILQEFECITSAERSLASGRYDLNFYEISMSVHEIVLQRTISKKKKKLLHNHCPLCNSVS